MTAAGFALLAPVPAVHLDPGRAVAEHEGYVAFGSRKWELFRTVEDRREGAPVPVLIYPSHEDAPAKTSFVVSWVGPYVGCEETDTGAHSTGMTHRPPTTADEPSDNIGHWSVFWHVRDLRELAPAERFPISALETVSGGWRKNAPPRGPEMVALPAALTALEQS